MTENKEWLTLSFFPQEDINELNRFRGQLTPFLKAVVNALSAELEVGFEREMKEPILNEVIQNIPPENSTSIAINNFANTMDTLQVEFDGILGR